MDASLQRLSTALGFEIPASEVLSRVRTVYEQVGREIAARPFSEPPCHAGCSACCHESVFLSAPEFLLVADSLLRTMPLSERNGLVKQMCRIAERFEDEFEQLAMIPDGPERDEVALRVKFTCPLLDSAGMCRVYDARELNARTFGLTYDSKRIEPYGCELTRARLKVLPPETATALFDARLARQMLVDRLPNTELVHVFPFWFQKFGRYLLPDPPPST